MYNTSTVNSLLNINLVPEKKVYRYMYANIHMAILMVPFKLEIEKTLL